MLDIKTAVATHLLSLHFFPGLIHFCSLLFPSFLFTLSHPDFFGWLLSFLIFLVFQMAGFFSFFHCLLFWNWRPLSASKYVKTSQLDFDLDGFCFVPTARCSAKWKIVWSMWWSFVGETNWPKAKSKTSLTPSWRKKKFVTKVVWDSPLCQQVLILARHHLKMM